MTGRNVGLSALVVVMLLSVACGSAVVSPAQTANGLLRAVQNAPGTFMMSSEQLLMVAWPQGQAYGFAVFSHSGNAVREFAELASCTGNGAGCETMSKLVNHLKGVGWWRIYALPAATVTQIKGLAKYFGVASAASFSLFVLPFGPAFEYQLNPQVDV